MKNLKEKICLGFEKFIDFNSEFYTHVTYVGGCISIALILLLFSSHIQNTVVYPIVIAIHLLGFFLIQKIVEVLDLLFVLTDSLPFGFTKIACIVLDIVLVIIAGTTGSWLITLGICIARLVILGIAHIIGVNLNAMSDNAIKITIRVGDTEKLRVDINNPYAFYEIKGPDIVEVSKNGILTAKKAGYVEISNSYDLYEINVIDSNEKANDNMLKFKKFFRENTVVIPSLLFLIPILLVAIPTMLLPIHFIFKILIIVLYIALIPLISLIADSLWVLD